MLMTIERVMWVWRCVIARAFIVRALSWRQLPERITEADPQGLVLNDALSLSIKTKDDCHKNCVYLAQAEGAFKSPRTLSL